MKRKGQGEGQEERKAVKMKGKEGKMRRGLMKDGVGECEGGRERRKREGEGQKEERWKAGGTILAQYSRKGMMILLL